MESNELYILDSVYYSSYHFSGGSSAYGKEQKKSLVAHSDLVRGADGNTVPGTDCS